MRRGEVWWADLGEPRGSGPGFHRPIVIVSANCYNSSSIDTVVCAIVTSNLRLANAPGNIRLPMRGTGLRQPAVVVVSQLVTLDKSVLLEYCGRVPDTAIPALDRGLQSVLGLD